MEDVRIDGCVLVHLQQLHLGTILHMEYHNGRVNSCDAASLNEIDRDRPDVVSSFAQQGFRFPPSMKGMET